MRRKLLTIFMLLFSMATFSQTFVEKYNKTISKEDGLITQWKPIDLTVVFNEDVTGDLVFYYGDGQITRFHQISGVKKSQTVKNEKYQLIQCIDSENGFKVGVQYFADDQTLRVVVDKNNYIEFYKN